MSRVRAILQHVAAEQGRPVDPAALAGIIDPPGDDDVVATHAGELARSLGLELDDSPLLRPLRDDERCIVGGRASSIDEAEDWLRRIVARRRVEGPIADSYCERLAPALLPLSAMNARFLAFDGVPLATRDERRRFFAALEQRCTDERYAAIQEKFLGYRALYCIARPRRAGATSLNQAEKYLHASHYVVSKIAAAKQFSLDRRGPSTILDLGAGPAHFGVVCEVLGHSYVGLDIPFSSTTPFSRFDLYGELFDALRMTRVLQRIRPTTPLEVPHRFDVVTSLMAIFCTRRTADGPVPWQGPEWEFFLGDLLENVVAPRFEIHIKVAAPFLDPSAYDTLRRFGADIDPVRNTIHLTNRD